MADKGSKFLQRPLYVFDLPPEILATLAFKQGSVIPVPPGNDESKLSDDKSEPTDSTETSSAKGISCTLCSMSFASVRDQRDHIRSDLHAFNLKQKLRGLKPVGELEFDQLVGDLDESLSGSESSESDSDRDDGFDTQYQSSLSTLLRRQAKITEEQPVETLVKQRKGPGKPPLFWFSSSELPPNASLGVYRALFTNAEQSQEASLVGVIRRKQLAPVKQANSGSTKQVTGGVQLPLTFSCPHYFLCMIGGGHFAAMIIALAPKEGKKHTGLVERSATVLAHKTFHRYTTRRKQGGAQSANDSSKGNAHSAGASIRRANEAALVNEVRDLLRQWKVMIDAAELHFIRATGKQNRSTLFGPYEGQILQSSDVRNRGFPFNTRRPTQSELMRCFVELTRVKVSQVDEAALAAAAAAAAATTVELAEKSSHRQTRGLQQVPPKVKPSKEDEVAALHTSQLSALIRRSKVPAILSYLSSNSLTGAFQFYPPDSQQHHHSPTPLHLAASINSAIVVSALLLKATADPAVLNNEGKSAFELAGDRATRDAFRVARHELGEDRWDWTAANIPSALTGSEAESRANSERQEKAAEASKESKRRQQETERLRAETEKLEADKREQRIGKGRMLSAVPEKSAAEKRDEEARGLTPEMRQRLERERRARAAEARLARMRDGGGG